VSPQDENAQKLQKRQATPIQPKRKRSDEDSELIRKTRPYMKNRGTFCRTRTRHLKSKLVPETSESQSSSASRRTVLTGKSMKSLMAIAKEAGAPESEIEGAVDEAKYQDALASLVLKYERQTQTPLQQLADQERSVALDKLRLMKRHQLLEMADERFITTERITAAEKAKSFNESLMGFIADFDAGAVKSELDAKARIQELSKLKTTGLSKLARDKGVPEPAVTEAADSECPIDSLIGLIMKSESSQHIAPQDSVPTQALSQNPGQRADYLRKMRPSDLAQMACDVKINKAKVDEAQNGSNHKEAMVQLILESETQAVSGGVMVDLYRQQSLNGMSFTELKALAEQQKVSKKKNVAAEDTCDRKSALVALIIASETKLNQKQSEEDLVQRRRELGALKNSELSDKAREIGASPADIETALNDQDYRGSLMALILKVATPCRSSSSRGTIAVTPPVHAGANSGHQFTTLSEFLSDPGTSREVNFKDVVLLSHSKVVITGPTTPAAKKQPTVSSSTVVIGDVITGQEMSLTIKKNGDQLEHKLDELIAQRVKVVKAIRLGTGNNMVVTMGDDSTLVKDMENTTYTFETFPYIQYDVFSCKDEKRLNAQVSALLNIMDVDPLTSKNGKPWASVTVMDQVGIELKLSCWGYAEELRPGQIVVARGLLVTRETEKNDKGKYVPTESGSRIVSFSEKLTSFQDVTEIQSLCDRMS
jgi:hypothetical protein